MKKTLTGISLLLVAFAAGAHHSRSTFYDMSRIVELEGEITRVQWRHPHVRYWIQADAAYGGEEWEMETTPPSLLERQGISRDILSAGTRVRVAGPPARLDDRAMEVSHVLLPDGREVLLHTGLEPRWTDNAVFRDIYGVSFSDEEVAAAEATADGIFRVWSRSATGERPAFWLDDYPLTDAARAVSEAYDPIVATDTSCRGKDMPHVMSSNWPFEFVDEGNQIRLKAEEFDRERIIHLQGQTGEVSPSPLGYSLGFWEDRDLIVATTHVSSGTIGRAGIPLSEDAEIFERFSLSADERRLDYEIRIVDHATFTEPVTMTSYWIWRPGEQVNPYNCIETPGSWTNADKATLLEDVSE